MAEQHYTRREALQFFTTQRTVQDDGNTDMTASSGAVRKETITAGLEPYTQPLDMQRALHLLRRISFAPTYAQASALVGRTADQAVEQLLGTGTESPPSAPGAWIAQGYENPDNADRQTGDAIRGTWRSQFAQLQAWWVNLMANETSPAIEKLTLFWSGHFTSEFTFDDIYNPPQMLYVQNVILRKDRLGDMRQLVEDITVDGAMLNYLGGNLNVAGRPNENYARELMELFTTGIGAYTEEDVKEAARVLTGWKVGMFSDAPAPNGIYQPYFVPSQHDVRSKTILGITIPARDQQSNTEALVRREEVRRLIDIIFEQRSSAVGKFIAEKLYRFFVYSNPSVQDQAFIGQLSALFRQSNWQIRPVLAALLKSAHFFDAANIGVQIKTPAEFVLGLARQLNLRNSATAGAMRSFEQDLIEPPNVAGWPGYREWISTKTYPLRLQYAQGLVNAMNNQQALAFAQQFPMFRNADQLVTAIEQYLLPRPILATRHQRYVAALLQGTFDYEWPTISVDANAAGPRIKALLLLMLRAPDIHLC